MCFEIVLGDDEDSILLERPACERRISTGAAVPASTRFFGGL